MNEFTPLPDEFTSTAAEYTIPREKYLDPGTEFTYSAVGAAAAPSGWRTTMRRLLATGAALVTGIGILGNSSGAAKRVPTKPTPVPRDMMEDAFYTLPPVDYEIIESDEAWVPTQAPSPTPSPAPTSSPSPTPASEPDPSPTPAPTAAEIIISGGDAS